MLNLLWVFACAEPPPVDTDVEVKDEAGITGGCSDTLDNDGDGASDCDDDSCDGLPMCTVDTDEDTEPPPCTEVTIDAVGPVEPIVGDSWTVLLECDGTNITSGVVIRLVPADFATVRDNVITFARGGTGTLKVQAGSERAEMDVVVLE